MLPFSASAAASDVPTTAYGRPSSCSASARSPPAIAVRMSELRTDRPSISNGGTTTRSKPCRDAEGRRPSPASPAGRARTPHRASSATRPAGPGRDPAEERVVLGRTQRGVEVLDDDDLDAGLPSSRRRLGRIEQERRRRAEDHLVGVRVERDDRRRGPAAARASYDEVPEQVRWPRWIPSNTPMTAKMRAVVRSQGVDAGRPSTGPRSGIRGRVCRCRRVDQDLVRREAAVAVPGDGDQASRSHRGRGSGPSPSGSGSADELAAGDRDDVLVGGDDFRQRIQARIDREQQRGEALRPVRGRRADVAPARSPDPAVNGPLAVRASAPRYAAEPTAVPEIAGERPDVRPRGARTSIVAIGRAGSASSQASEVQRRRS